ncbi:glutamine amidotransferase class 1 [Niveomyces insectorum RCEF 264]|uniref:Glutamine amidotransferase class 1 n=1 Tax=Niveomyces insectorum RCEF 264 TaxID=1081102 RepID=A0A167YPP7_9HYPO|nr:glutamine amidotransferase class 1 [Niveomyces insectorum RCEF 264]
MGSQSEVRPLRLAILMADTPLPRTQAAFQTYGGVFIDLFRRALAPTPLESVFTITTHDVVSDGFEAAYPDLAAVDAILITGSRHDSFANTPWIEELVAFTRRALATTAAPPPPPGGAGADGGEHGNRPHPVRVLGICFGHQICARALGAPVQRSPTGWEVSVTDVTLSPEGTAFFGQDTLKIHQMHRDAVLAYPPGAVPLAATTICPVQGMLLPGRAVTVQGHPEFTGPIVREILEARHAAGVIGDDLYGPGIDRVDGKHDGEAIARAFVKFLRDA